MSLLNILITWHLVGGVMLFVGTVWKIRPNDVPSLLNPTWIYDEWMVNIFGCILLTVFFNLLCPAFSVFYWLYKLIHFACTAGRTDEI